MKYLLLTILLIATGITGCDSVQSFDTASSEQVSSEISNTSNSELPTSYSYSENFSDIPGYQIGGSFFQMPNDSGTGFKYNVQTIGIGDIDSDIYFHFIVAYVYADGVLVRTYSHNYQNSHPQFSTIRNYSVGFNSATPNNIPIEFTRASGVQQVKIKIHHEAEGNNSFENREKVFVFNNQRL